MKPYVRSRRIYEKGVTVLLYQVHNTRSVSQIFSRAVSAPRGASARYEATLAQGNIEETREANREVTGLVQL